MVPESAGPEVVDVVAADGAPVAVESVVPQAERLRRDGVGAVPDEEEERAAGSVDDVGSVAVSKPSYPGAAVVDRRQACPLLRPPPPRRRPCPLLLRPPPPRAAAREDLCSRHSISEKMVALL